MGKRGEEGELKREGQERLGREREEGKREGKEEAKREIGKEKVSGRTKGEERGRKRKGKREKEERGGGEDSFWNKELKFTAKLEKKSWKEGEKRKQVKLEICMKKR